MMDCEESYVSTNPTEKSYVSSIRSDCAVYVLHSNARIFASAIAALSKLGDELFLRPQVDGICLKAYNKNRTAHGAFLFANRFFSSYDIKSLQNVEARYCRVSMKTALSLFKSAHFMERNLVSCTLTVDCHGHELHIEFLHSYDVTRSFNVNVMETREPFTSVFNKNNMENTVAINACEIASFLNEMRTGNEELMMCVQNDKFMFQNYLPYDDGMYDIPACRTEITLQKASFKSFIVRRQTVISLCMKEFKVLCYLIPLIVAVEQDCGYSAEFTIATIEGNDQNDDASPALTQRPSHVHCVQEEQNEVLQHNKRSSNRQVNGLQSQTASQQSIPMTQPNPINHLLDDEAMEIDEFRVENMDEQQRNFGTQPTSSNSLMDNSVCIQKDTVPLVRHDVKKAKWMENISTERKSACPSREVNVEFQRRFLGIGVKKQNQSQVSTMVTTIVEPTQWPMGRK